MDENRIEGAATNLGGKAKDAVGALTGDTMMQAEGKADQLSGRAQHAYGSAKDSLGGHASAFGTDLQRFTKERPLVALLLAAGVGYTLRSLTRRR